MTAHKESSRTKGKIFIYLGASIVIMLAIVTVIASRQLARMQLGQGTKTNQQCQSEQQAVHTITIQKSKATPDSITAWQCGKLTIINQDAETRLMTFGLHEAHTPYDGISEKLLGKDQSFTVTLVQSGSFRVHDHIHDKVQATFNVNPQTQK